MDNKRMDQLVFMFSYITHLTKKEAREIILQTATGRAVQAKNPTVMYEQQTENINSLALELRNQEHHKDLTALFTIDAIIQSMQALEKMENRDEKYSIVKPIVIASKPELKAKEKIQNLVIRKNMLQIKQQNLINARRIERADKLKG